MTNTKCANCGKTKERHCNLDDNLYCYDLSEDSMKNNMKFVPQEERPDKVVPISSADEKTQKGCGKEIDYLIGDDGQYYTRICRENDLCPSCKSKSSNSRGAK